MKSKLYGILKQSCPSSWVEWALFIFFLVSYGILAKHIALTSTIVFDDRIPWDAYFSFDNRAIVMTGGGYERHPLSNYFFDAIREFSLWVSSGQKNHLFRLSLALLSSLAISWTMVFIFKYLKNIIQLSLASSLILVIFFGLFSTNIMLSFTPETYTYSLLFLSGFTYYAALRLTQKRTLSWGMLCLSSLVIGGLTITNIAKVYIPILFERKWYNNIKHLANAVAKVGLSVGVFLLLFMYRMNFQFSAFLDKTGQQYEKFSQPKLVPIWDMVVSWFWGGNVLFPSFIIRDYHNKQNFHYKALFMEVYTTNLSYVFVGLLFLLVVWGYLRGFRKPLVQVLMLSFLVDIMIHCVLKFGLHTSYIYGGHFVFVIPLILGWLLHSYRKNTNATLGLQLFLGLMTLFLALNNFYRMNEFLSFLAMYYNEK
ncbi:DUF6080 domain-containing protein [Riemerella anatipestifer]|nr:DUF6080 domain-containing protein [Riemerella anatipestifer]